MGCGASLPFASSHASPHLRVNRVADLQHGDVQKVALITENGHNGPGAVLINDGPLSVPKELPPESHLPALPNVALMAKHLVGDLYQRQFAKRRRRKKLQRHHIDRILAAELYSERAMVDNERLSLRSSSRAYSRTTIVTAASGGSSDVDTNVGKMATGNSHCDHTMPASAASDNQPSTGEHRDPAVNDNGPYDHVTAKSEALAVETTVDNDHTHVLSPATTDECHQLVDQQSNGAANGNGPHDDAPSVSVDTDNQDASLSSISHT